MNQLTAICVSAFFLFFPVFSENRDKPVFRQISRADIASVKGKATLKWMRNWGGDDEDGDADNFFKGPTDAAVNSKKQVIICDKYMHRLNIFSNDGKLLQTIGRPGQGPGDLYGPFLLQIAANDDILVLDSLKGRIQRFNANGNHTDVFKIQTSMFHWFGVTASDELLIYDHDISFQKRILLSVCDQQGKAVRSVGVYDDPSLSPLEAELLYFDTDKTDNIYVLNSAAPLIRKYSQNGKLLLVIATEPPYENPIHISMNTDGSDIVRMDRRTPGASPKILRQKNGVSVNMTAANGKEYRHVKSIAADDNGNIYVWAFSKWPEIDPKKRCTVGVGASTFKVYGTQYRDTEVIDYYHLLIYNRHGEIIASVPVNRRCDKIRVFGNRLFIIEGLATQRISEFEIQFHHTGPPSPLNQ